MSRILVLCGGDNSERRVSLASGDAVSKGLTEAGHDVLKLDTSFPETVVDGLTPLLEGPVGTTPPDEQNAVRMDTAKWQQLTQSILNSNVDAVFPILHGSWGEDGHIQGWLDLLNVPYLGSGMIASSRAMDKHTSRLYASILGLPVAEGFFITDEAPIDEVKSLVRDDLGFPVVVKPNHGGSSADLIIANNEEEVVQGVINIRKSGDDVLIEEFIDGCELTVSMLDGSPLPVIEIAPKDGFYDYTNKYTHGKTEYICPAPIDPEIARHAQEMSEQIYEQIGCRHLARVDWRLNKDNDLFFLEVNTIPGMTSLSLVPMAAKAVGVDFPGLMDRFVKMVIG